MLTPDPSWIPGENCDIILRHPQHADLPLILYRTPADPVGPRVRIHYEVYWPADTTQTTEPVEVRHLWFTVLVTDDMLCPDGSWYPLTPAEVRTKLNAILLEKANIRLTTRESTIQGLYGEDHVVIDTIYQSAHTLEIHLTTRVLIDIPPESGGSMWLANAADLSSVWNTAGWG